MKTLQSAPLAALTVATALLAPGLVSAGSDIVSDTPPPAPRVEHEPRRHPDGYSWAPGYWEWNGRFFHWVSGAWILERRNQHWVADHWDPAGSQWHYVRGHWEQ